MTKIFICSLILITIIKGAIYSGISRSSFVSYVTEMNDHMPSARTNNAVPVKNIPINMESHGSSEKSTGHAPAMDETPHIHRFHRGRIRKLKKHHGKFWLLSQVLLVLCHLAILYIGYLHIVH